MSLFNWLLPQKGRSFASSAHGRHRRATGLVSGPQASVRQLRRNQRREQLYALVRESMVRAGVLSTSYQFKALTLDADGNGFMVLIDLAQPDLAMPDPQRALTELWLQEQAQRRHAMEVRAVYWRLQAGAAATTAHPRPQPLRPHAPAAPTDARMDDGVAARAHQQPALPTAAAGHGQVQAVTADEIQALRRALQGASRGAAPFASGASPSSLRAWPREGVQAPVASSDPAGDTAIDEPSAFSPLGQTQYGKL